MSGNESEFSLPVRIFYEDTDAGGIVYYVNYLKFMERARTERLRSLGFGQRALLEHGFMFVVRDAQINYRRSARLDDLVEVTANVIKAGRASLVFQQSVRLEGGELCSGRFTIACVDSESMKPMALPDACRQYLDGRVVPED
ncbi:tol-pal system-associated acyl-CoA thioesterase [Kistimonas scapharcae]|uniref:Tol-pal system-associated acyl-CoA thioesterase n=1 Tax=Kistimonas scapharcae TaxID=1036133 RepID=A0ABP8UYV5_9GAMM